MREGWTWERHELSEGTSCIVYDEHGRMIADHLTEERAAKIAAAPDLLEALKWFIDDIDSTHTRMVDFDANVARARAALRRAGGG